MTRWTTGTRLADATTARITLTALGLTVPAGATPEATVPGDPLSRGPADGKIPDRPVIPSSPTTGRGGFGCSMWSMTWLCFGSRCSLWVVLGLLTVLSGTAHAKWTVTKTPAHLINCLLLTDGSVMCLEAFTNQWHRLFPDINGSYATGTWAATKPMPDGFDTSGSCTPSCTYAPFWFASAVLPDGRLVVVGGIVNNHDFFWTDIGFMYDPVLDTWSFQLKVPFPTGHVGSATVVLDDGTMLMARSDLDDFDIAAFDPATLTFKALGPTNKQDSNDVEHWNILPDGRVLTVDTRIESQFELYDPATNSWSFGPTPVNLMTCCDAVKLPEAGPGVLRPDGTLVYFSANETGQNAVYDTKTGVWSHTTAMDFPLVPGKSYHYHAPDFPASLLPDGNVLVLPADFPRRFFEFDGTSLTPVADTPQADVSFMLLLPSGEVLLTGDKQEAVFYSNGGPPQDAWRPVITSAPSVVNTGSTYTIEGRLFNGFSEGATSGNRAAMSTNYPLVRLRNPQTGHVFYARTHDHSTMGVELVDSPVITQTQFDMPKAMDGFPVELEVVVNGIASQPILLNGPDLSISMKPQVVLTQGGKGETYVIDVSNVGPTPTRGAVTVVVTLPASLRARGMSGPGWRCDVPTLTCKTADVLDARSSYPSITLTVDVANDAPIQVTTHATASGGGEGTNTTENNSISVTASIRQHTTTTVRPATGDYHDEVTLAARVAPAGVSGRVEFFVNRVSAGWGTYSGRTGVATLTYVSSLAAGSYSLRADFRSGEVLYLDSTDTLPNGMTVTREETTLTYTGDTDIPAGGTANLRALLVEDGARDNDRDGGVGGPVIVGRRVHFTLGTDARAQTCDGVTDDRGVATCRISPVAQPLGPGTVVAAFAQDEFYQASSDRSATLILRSSGR